VLEAGEQLHELQGRPSGVLRINAARISAYMVLQPLLAGFLKAYPDVQVELTNDEGYVDIVERGFAAGIRMGESVQKDMIAHPSVARSQYPSLDRPSTSGSIPYHDTPPI
jgi:DNA-binding transcriptional LysR family regulator